MTDLVTLRDRAQAIANDTGQPRWVVYTSLGWRIEAAEPKGSVYGTSPYFRRDPTPVPDPPEAP